MQARKFLTNLLSCLAEWVRSLRSKRGGVIEVHPADLAYCSAPGQFVMIPDEHTVAFSADGLAWTEYSLRSTPASVRRLRRSGPGLRRKHTYRERWEIAR